MSLDSRLFRPSRSNSNSASSAFVSVGVCSDGTATGRGGVPCSMLMVPSTPPLRSFFEPARFALRCYSPWERPGGSSAQSRANPFRRPLPGGRQGGLDALVGQRERIVHQFEAHGHTVFTRCQITGTLWPVQVEQRGAAHHAARVV